LGTVLASELYAAAPEAGLRRDMLHAARDLSPTGAPAAFAAKIQGAPPPDHPDRERFLAEVDALREVLAAAGEFRSGEVVAAVQAALRERIPFLDRDRALDGEVAEAVHLVADGVLLEAARRAQAGEAG